MVRWALMSTVGAKRTGATLEDLLAMPEEGRYELVGGVVVPKEAGSQKHGAAQIRLARSLGPFDRRPGARRIALEGGGLPPRSSHSSARPSSVVRTWPAGGASTSQRRRRKCR